MAGLAASSAVADGLVLRWIFGFALSFSNTGHAPPTTSLLNEWWLCLLVRLQVVEDDRAELASVRCSIDLDAVCLINESPLVTAFRNRKEVVNYG